MKEQITELIDCWQCGNAMSKTILLKNNTKLSVCARDQCQVPWSAEDLKTLELWEEETGNKIYQNQTLQQIRKKMKDYGVYNA